MGVVVSTASGVIGQFEPDGSPLRQWVCECDVCDKPGSSVLTSRCTGPGALASGVAAHARCFDEHAHDPRCCDGDLADINASAPQPAAARAPPVSLVCSPSQPILSG